MSTLEVSAALGRRAAILLGVIILKELPLFCREAPRDGLLTLLDLFLPELSLHPRGRFP